jgi:hypothetical protein
LNNSYISRLHYTKFWSGKPKCPSNNVADLWAEQIIVPAIFYIYDDMIDDIKNFFNKQNWEFWFEWLCTIILIVGVALTSYNVYPLNIWLSFLGNLGWMVLGYIWRKWSLFVVELIITIIYIAGIYNIL